MTDDALTVLAKAIEDLIREPQSLTMRMTRRISREILWLDGREYEIIRFAKAEEREGKGSGQVLITGTSKSLVLVAQPRYSSPVELRVEPRSMSVD